MKPQIHVICESIVWCLMCDVPDINLVRFWIFELMRDLKCTIFCCFVRPPMELIVNAKHRFCRLITSFFTPVYSRAVGKLIKILLYSNFMAFKVKLDCQIYVNKITCNLNIVSFYIRSVQKLLFLFPFTFVPTDFSPL